MVGQDRWEEIHRRAGAGASIRAIARELDVDRKTVRRCLRQTEWKPYQRAARADTLLATHAAYLRRRGADVGYSAQVLFQELRGRQYEGSYETVKRFVRPLREMQLSVRRPGMVQDLSDIDIDFEDARGWSSYSEGRVQVQSGSVPNLIHEISHHLEYRHPGLLKEVKAFRNSRLKPGELPQKLRDLYPGSNYRHNEIAYEDEFGKFTGYYAGKVYPHWTEILTIGMQSLYTDPVGFARKDPKYFEFILRAVTGMR